MTIQKYLDDNDYKVTHIAVECKEQIIDKSDYTTYILKDNDVVEIVSFVGGDVYKRQNISWRVILGILKGESVKIGF